MKQRKNRTLVCDSNDRDLRGSNIGEVLCIDDDSNVGESLRRRFRKQRVPMIYAHSGRQGIWLAVSKQPQVIITDIRMPDGDGGYVLKRLKEDPRTADIPVIVLTGVDDPVLEEQVLELGAVCLFQKPAPFRELFSEVERFLAAPV